MSNNKKQEEDRRELIDKKDRHVTPGMTAEELIESIRGKIQHVLTEKAKNPNHREK